MTVVVDGESLTLAQLVAVARDGEPVALGAGVVERMAAQPRRSSSACSSATTRSTA